MAETDTEHTVHMKEEDPLSRVNTKNKTISACTLKVDDIVNHDNCIAAISHFTIFSRN